MPLRLDPKHNGYSGVSGTASHTSFRRIFEDMLGWWCR